jgi:hypothetical protein
MGYNPTLYFRYPDLPPAPAPHQADRLAARPESARKRLIRPDHSNLAAGLFLAEAVPEVNTSITVVRTVWRDRN